LKKHSTFSAQWAARDLWLKDEADAPALRWASEFSQRENCHLQGDAGNRRFRGHWWEFQISYFQISKGKGQTGRKGHKGFNIARILAF